MNSLSEYPFQPYGPSHVAALLVVAVGCVGLVTVARAGPDSTVVRVQNAVLAAVLLAVYPLQLALLPLVQPYAWDNALPLHLCDVAALVGGFALLTRRPLAAELTYFWGLAATVHGLVTPAVGVGFPHPEFFRFFVLHGAVVMAAVYLPLGLKLRPRRGAVLRVFLCSQVYLAVAGFVDWITGANYGFLRAKPASSTLLDVLGPWPWYLLALEAIALAVFLVLNLPFAALRRIEGTARRADAINT